MEIELKSFTPAEQATFRLRALYEQAGYRKYRASRFEEYALYQEYQRFLPDSQVITFTDLDGKLRATPAGRATPSRPSTRWVWRAWVPWTPMNRPLLCGWRCKALPRWKFPPCWSSATWVI